MRQATNGGGVVCLYVCWVQRWTLHNGWTNRYAVREACPFGRKEQMRCAYWRHLSNTIEWCVRCGFTSNYCDHLFCYIVVGRWKPQHYELMHASQMKMLTEHRTVSPTFSGLDYSNDSTLQVGYCCRTASTADTTPPSHQRWFCVDMWISVKRCLTLDFG